MTIIFKTKQSRHTLYNTNDININRGQSYKTMLIILVPIFFRQHGNSCFLSLQLLCTMHNNNCIIKEYNNTAIMYLFLNRDDVLQCKLMYAILNLVLYFAYYPVLYFIITFCTYSNHCTIAYV